jgi:hypothetical protein
MIQIKNSDKDDHTKRPYMAKVKKKKGWDYPEKKLGLGG